MKRKRLAIIGIAFILVVSVSAYVAEPEVSYSLNPYQYRKIGDTWNTFNYSSNQTSSKVFTTVHCQNKGGFDANFYVILTLTDAHFNQTNNQSYSLVNETTAKISYTLHGQEKTNTDVYFIVDSNATGFKISISFQSNQLFMRSSEGNWGGQDTFYYGETSDRTFIPGMLA
jgi:hypothetical protein